MLSEIPSNFRMGKVQRSDRRLRFYLPSCDFLITCRIITHLSSSNTATGVRTLEIRDVWIMLESHHGCRLRGTCCCSINLELELWEVVFVQVTTKTHFAQQKDRCHRNHQLAARGVTILLVSHLCNGDNRENYSGGSVGASRSPLWLLSPVQSTHHPSIVE